MESDKQEWAEESVAPQFTRIMRATTSRYGVLTDPPLIGLVESALVIGAITLYQTSVIGAEQLTYVWAALALPISVGVVFTVALLGARKRIVSWLAAQPFPIENFNGLLNGVAQNLIVRFEGDAPERDALNEVLEAVHPDCFCLEFTAGEPEVEVRIGVPDSKMNPASANHRRYLRVKTLIEGALVPISQKHPIERVHIS